MTFERIIDNLNGHFGWYQFLAVFAFGLHIQSFSSSILMNSVFVEFRQDYNCSSHDENLVMIDDCHLWQNSSQGGLKIACREWQFDNSLFDSTIRSQYDMTCDREWQVSLASTCHMLGKLIGGGVFGILSDRFGRFKIIQAATFIVIVSSLTAGFVPYFWSYCLARFVSGFAVAGLYVVPITYLSEIAHSSKRLHYLLLSCCGLTLGGIFLTVIAYFQRNHFYIQMMCIGMGLPIFFYSFIFTESPRWLAAKGHTKRAIEACKKISRINRRTFLEEKELEELCTSIGKDTENSKQQFWESFNYPHLRRVILTVLYIHSVGTFIYYLLILGSGSFGSNIFVNFVSGFLLEIPFLLVGFLFSRKYGRVAVLVPLFLICALTITSSGILIGIPNTEFPVTILSQVARGCIAVATYLLWIYEAEIFPTVARSSLIGAANALSGIVCLLSPQMENLVKIWPPLPFLICGGLSVIGVSLMWLYLPETFQMQSKDYLQEADEFIKLSKHSICTRDSLCCTAVNDLGNREIELFEASETT